MQSPPPGRSHPRTLGTQVALLASCCLLVSIVGYGWFAARHQAELAVAASLKEATLLTQDVASTVSSHLILEDYISVEKTLLSVAGFHSIVRMQVLDPSGLVLSHVEREPGQEPEVQFQLRREPIPMAPGTPVEAAARMVLWEPVGTNGRYGWVKITYSTEELTALEQRIFAQSLVGASLAALVTVTALLLFLRPRIRALARIRRFAANLDEHLGARLDIPRSALELEALAEALNHASERLFHSDAALKRSEAQFRLLLNSTAEAIMGVDRDGKCTFLNPACLTMLGYSEQADLIGTCSRRLLGDAVWQRLSLQRADMSRRLHFDDITFATRRGEAFAAELWAHPILDGAETVGHVITFVDITSRKQTQAALWESERMFRDLTENVQSVFWIKAYDRDSILYVSPAYEEIWGRPCSELYDDPCAWARCVHPDDRDAVRRACLNAVHGYDEEYRILRPDGSVRWIRDRAFPVRHADGSIHRIAGVAVDITDRVVAEERHRAYQSSLAVQRALEKQNAELQLMRQRALEASRVKSEFLANMSHEIRTPINAIVGFADVLTRSDLPEEQRDHVEYIRKSASNLLALINDILDLSKIEAGKLQLRRIPFDLRECVEDVFAMLAPAAHRKGLDVVPMIYNDVPLQLIGDPIRLKQVLTNLVDNAVKFTHGGSVILRVMLEDESPDEVVLRFSIADTGPGIAPEFIDRLFDSFSQADASYTREQRGTGLGLSISRKLVRQMEGEIELTTEQGKGTTFYFVIPLKRQPIPQDDVAAVSGLAGLTVAVCEPHPLSRSYLTHLLTALGLDVRDFASAVDLARKLDSDPTLTGTCKLIIVGFSLDDGRFPQFLDLVAQLKQKFPARILALTGTHQRSAFKQLATAGADACSTKPPRRSELHDVLHRLLSGADPAMKPPAVIKDHPARRADIKVLVAEDNEINRCLIATLLSRRGLEPVVVTNGRDALKQAIALEPDLIIMDIHMPLMNGLEAARRIREAVHKRISIVALTADALIGERENLTEQGFDGLLIKPVQEHTLWETVNSTVARTGAGNRPSSGRDAQRLDPELVARIRPMLLRNLPQLHAQLGAALRAGDWSSVRHLAHDLAGSSCYCDLPELNQAATALEQHVVARTSADLRVAAAEQLLQLIEYAMAPLPSGGTQRVSHR